MKKLFLIPLVLFSCSHLKKAGWVFSSNPTNDMSQSIVRGQKIYQNNCMSCHGSKAMGDGLQVKNLKSKPSNLINVARERWDSTFAAHVAYGKEGNEEMPQFHNVLSEQDIWDVTNYVYSLK